MRRLLEAGDLNEAKEVAAAIRSEMAVLDRRSKILFRRASQKALLLSMLGAVEQDDHNQLRFWARWKRLASPTTSNAAEAVHGILNKATQCARSFIHRLELVKGCLWARFEERNSDKRIQERAVNHLFRGGKYDRLSPGNQAFYLCLHSFALNHRFVGEKWVFPEVQIEEHFPPAEWFLMDRRPDASFYRAEVEDADVQEPGTDATPIPAKTRAGTPCYLRTGRYILRTVRLISHTRKADVDELAKEVWKQGEFHGLVDQQKIDAAQETAWRMAVYVALRLVD